MTTLLLVAGETSGDVHGANLARELRILDPSLRLIGAGGPRMREAGVELIEDTTTYASVGIIEAFHQMHRFARLYRLLSSALKREKPAGSVLIDFPDFNLRFAERSKDHGVPVIYYISPQVWAWRPGRIKTIRRVVRKMIVIFDFEEALYRKHGVDVAFVGHPLLDQIDQAPDRRLRDELHVGNAPLIGLLPGSREKQFKALFPRMAQAAEIIRKELPAARFVVACAPKINPRKAMGRELDVVWNRTPEVMAASDLLITASGTATVEAAIHGTPMIVTYFLNPISAYTLGSLVRLDHYAMVNIIAGRKIMPELYQSKAKPELLSREAIAILRENRLPKMRADLAEVLRKLGEPGASRRAAEEILRTLA